MICEELQPHELGSDLFDAWEALRETHPAFASPFYSPHFVRLMGQVRDDLRILLLRRDRQILGFLPLHRHRFGRATLLGWPLCDHHGIIAAPDQPLDLVPVLRKMGVHQLRFLYAPRTHKAFARHITETAEAPILKLAHFRVPSHDLRKLRKMEREVGPVEFRSEGGSADDLRQLIAWKRSQVARTNFYPLFANDWIEPLLEALRSTGDEQFAGALTTLRAGGRLVAAHIGPRTGRVWHWWFPTYDPEFGAYSPGLLLMLLTAQEARDRGFEWIDFGDGQQQFKSRFANDCIELGRGAIETSIPARCLSRVHRAAAGVARATQLKQRLRRLRSRVSSGSAA